MAMHTVQEYTHCTKHMAMYTVQEYVHCTRTYGYVHRTRVCTLYNSMYTVQ